MSYWDHRKPVRRARSVDIDALARISVALLDDGGLRSLTLRSAAARAGVAPASLYSRIVSLDDLFDLALDQALMRDPDVNAAVDGANLRGLMVAFYNHLLKHPWAGQVIGMRAPRGPGYLRLSERMCALLLEMGASDPLGTAYSLSNFVIGSAMTAPMARDERAAGIDRGIAPLYADLHAHHDVDTDAMLAAGLDALLTNMR
ncbi:MAG: TetR/AcrR family transcriptional regulator C-terminal domain-containing protein [Mobilicoccus sp.]|nr:TetR/AcrR family transcriptional regulator C-terminal domain-containing protein [Mobilicoccus sp.]